MIIIIIIVINIMIKLEGFFKTIPPTHTPRNKTRQITRIKEQQQQQQKRQQSKKKKIAIHKRVCKR